MAQFFERLFDQFVLVLKKKSQQNVFLFRFVMVILQRTAQRRTVVAGGIGIGYSEHSPTNVYAGRKSENMIVCVCGCVVCL